MNTNKSVRALTEAGLGAALTVIFALVSMYIPVLSLAAFFMIAVPSLIVGARNGAAYSMMSMAAASLLVTALSSPVTGLGTLLLYGPTAVVTSFCLKRKTSYLRAVVSGTVATIAGFGGLLLFYQVTSGVPVIESMINMFSSSYDAALASYEGLVETGTVSSEQVEQFKEYYKTIIDTMSKTVPATIIIASAALETAAVVISSFIMKRTRITCEAGVLPPFETFSLPRSMTIGVVVCVILAYGAGKLTDLDTSLLLLNIYAVFSFMFVIQGLSFVLSWLKKRVPGPVSWVIIIFLVISAVGRMILLFAGLFDICFDPRKLNGGDTDGR